MLLSVRHLNLAYGPKVLFREAAFNLHPRSRAGLVGPNGSGKTTLLKILNGLQEADSVEVESRSGVSFGYLPQEGIVLQDRPVIEEAESAASDIQLIEKHLRAVEEDLKDLPPDSEAYAECLERLGHYTHQLEDLEAHKLRAKTEKILFGLGFREADLARSCGEFSGGWQMRIALTRLLLEEPDLLMMDEPTNHLDLETLDWFQNQLKRYSGAILTISHDREFLNAICGGIVEIAHEKLQRYQGNYEKYLVEKAEREAQHLAAYNNQQREIAHLEDFVRRF
ncbi:MAG TPA: ATP-binding cassette domain-containing protein, partial [Oceanipulchritudo sp.]|nr:ATP-binding cassette domain-containing protein [Oceanipulchritudo sp.]